MNEPCTVSIYRSFNHEYLGEFQFAIAPQVGDYVLITPEPQGSRRVAKREIAAVGVMPQPAISIWIDNYDGPESIPE